MVLNKTYFITWAARRLISFFYHRHALHVNTETRLRKQRILSFSVTERDASRDTLFPWNIPDSIILGQ